VHWACEANAVVCDDWLSGVLNWGLAGVTERPHLRENRYCVGPHQELRQATPHPFATPIHIM